MGTPRRIGIDKWKVFIAYAQNQMLRPRHVIVLVLPQSLSVAEIILIALRRVCFRFQIWQCVVAVV